MIVYRGKRLRLGWGALSSVMWRYSEWRGDQALDWEDGALYISIRDICTSPRPAPSQRDVVGVVEHDLVRRHRFPRLLGRPHHLGGHERVVARYVGPDRGERRPQGCEVLRPQQEGNQQEKKSR